MPHSPEDARLRHVHEYLPITADLYSQGTGDAEKTSPDSTLTAFAQLLTLKLDVQRAVICLAGRGRQYFLAEATAALDLPGTGASDWLWMGSTESTARRDALFAHTLKASIPDKGYGFYCIPDLLKDPEFQDTRFAGEHPHFRFFASTPLVGNEGYRIGCLFVVDDRPRSTQLAQSEINYFGVIAKNVVQYLRMLKDSEDRNRIAVMSKGLAAFTEGRERIPTEWKSEDDTDTGTYYSHARDIDKHQSLAKGDHPEDATAPTVLSYQDRRTSLPQGTGEDLPRNGYQRESQTYEDVLARGSNLLRECLNVDYTVFFDAKPVKLTPRPSARDITTFEDPSEPLQPPLKYRERNPKADTLSFSTEKTSTAGRGHPSSAGIRAMEVRLVRRLIKRYPQGRLWSFDVDGNVAEVEESPLALDSDSSTDSGDQAESGRLSPQREAESLVACFPGVRQVLYAPVYDPATSKCICACFAVSLHEIPVFTTEIEVAFARAFLNNVAVEWDRVAISISDRQKGDFLSSISHEFRSPLHGILASIDLLSESKLGASERGLCDTVKSCGQTLLNTVSHMLDYSKMNDYHRRLPDPKSSQHESFAQTRIDTSKSESGQELPPAIGLYADVDVACICEAAVTTVCAGNTLDESYSGAQTRRVSGQSRGGEIYGLDQTFNDNSDERHPVTVVLNIRPGNWRFSCPPGAIQRILMNLVGNGLKYTYSGHVKVSLEIWPPIEEASGTDKVHSLMMIVQDTGIGISEDFLRHKLYSPFTQESIHAPGTGLGLSIVKKIVQTLQGKIAVHSELGKGTEVSVRIPLTRVEVDDSEPSSPSHFYDAAYAPSLMQAQYSKKTVFLYGSGLDPTTLLGESLYLYITGWFHLIIIKDLYRADFVIVDESALSELVATLKDPFLPSRVTVLRSKPITQQLPPIDTDDILKPFGPARLAKGLLISWARKAAGTRVLSRSLSAQTVSQSKLSQLSRLSLNTHDTAESTAPHQAKSHSTLPLRVGRHSKDATRPTSFPNQYSPKQEHESQLSTLSIPAEGDLMMRSSPSDTQSNTLPTRLRQPYILCVDDNHLNLKLLQAYLEKLDYTNIKCAKDGLEASNIVETTDIGFDLIFMDLSMPVCDGFESAKRIRKHERLRRRSQGVTAPRPPAFIVALTGQASNQDEEHAFACGMDHFVTKPLSLSQLRELLSGWETKQTCQSKGEE